EATGAGVGGSSIPSWARRESIPISRLLPARCRRRAGARSLPRLEPLPSRAQHGPALQLVQASPDPVGLTDAERVLEALRPDRAAGADGLGLGFPGLLLLPALEVVRGEEQGRLLAVAGSPELPADGPFPARDPVPIAHGAHLPCGSS